MAVLIDQAFPAIRPSFLLDYSSWHATDIVLVVTTATDGTFEVIESWKGDLHLGERIVVPELRPTPNAIPISRYPTSWFATVRGGVSELIPRQPVGSRMMLFLKSGVEEQVLPNRTGKSERYGWKPSDVMHTMKASAVWIDRDQLYCFTQPENPGPSVLSMSRNSQESLLNRIAEIKDIQEHMSAVLATKDGKQRAELLKPYVRSDVFPAQRFALEELGKSGFPAVGTIRGMLDDPAFADEASELVKSLVQAGGDAVGEELNRRLQQDLAFWRSIGPSLAPGWWNKDATLHAPLRERYAQTYQLILGLKHTRNSATLDTAMQLRDFWRSLPQLNDLDDMASECDRLIRQLQTN